MEATVDALNTYRMFGLSNGDSSTSHTDIDFAIYMAGTTLKVYERGMFKGDFGTLAVGDVLRVAVENNVVKYYKNGTLVYTSTVPPTAPLAFNVSLLTMSASVQGATVQVP